MAKSKGKSSRKKAQIEEVVQCPHLHFKTDVIDRNVLSKEQHLNLLSTPKGYHWDESKKDGGDGGPVEELSSFSPRRIMCSGRRMKKAEKVYVHNFLAEVWNLLTPEMVDRLKGMLMNEFGMSPQEADDFICKQREENIVNSSTVSFYKKPRDIGDGKYVYDHVVKTRNPNKAHCDKIPKSNLGIRNTWIKDFSDSLSDMMSSYVLDTMCAERTDRQQEIAHTLLNRFNTLLEQNASMSDPKTPTDKTMVLVADRLATWLDNNVDVSKEAVQQIKIMGEAEQRKKMEEDRKRRHEQMKKERERREAEEEAQRLADEQAQKFSREDQDKELSDEEQAQKLAEEENTPEEEDESPAGSDEPTTEKIQPETAGEQSEGPAAGQKEDGEAQKAEEEQPKKESEEAKPDAAEVNEHDEQKEKNDESAAVAAEQQKALDELKQKEEDEKAAEAEKLRAEEDQKIREAEEEEAAKAEQQRVEEEQRKVEQAAAEIEKQRAEEENKKDQEVAEAEKQKAEEERINAENEAAELAEIEKHRVEDEQKKKLEELEADPKKASEELADEKPVAGPSEQALGLSDVPVEDIPPSETTESEPPVSDLEDEQTPVLPDEKGDEVEPVTGVEDKPVDQITPEVAGRVESGLSPEEKVKRTNEVLKSVASIILETKADSSPRQEALKDIMEKQLEENLGDQDKEAIGKVSSKIGTWIDKMVDQATLEYGEREPSRPPPGSDDIWAPASSRARPPISGPSGMKAPGESGLVPGVSRAPTEPGSIPGVSGVSTQPGLVPGVTGAPTHPGWVPGVTGAPSQPGWTPGVTGAYAQRVPEVGTALGQPGRVPGFGRTLGEPGLLPGISEFQESGAPRTRVPIAQRPKGRIYHLSRSGSGFDVNMISNTRAQEKIRLARGKSPAYDNVPNPDAPMEPSDLKKWYNWTSALGEVAESWAEWIKDTIKGTQQRGEEMARDNSPQQLNEWREFRDNRAQSARKWQQTKKDMEQRAEMWSKKRRRVQSR